MCNTNLFFLWQNNDGSKKLSGDQLIELYKSFVAEYPICSIEDPFDQDDFEHYTKFTQAIGEKVQIVGDDLLVTNPKVSDRCIALHFFPLPEAAAYQQG
jgi:enolase